MLTAHYNFFCVSVVLLFLIFSYYLSAYTIILWASQKAKSKSYPLQCSANSRVSKTIWINKQICIDWGQKVGEYLAESIDFGIRWCGSNLKFCIYLWALKVLLLFISISSSVNRGDATQLIKGLLTVNKLLFVEVPHPCGKVGGMSLVLNFCLSPLCSPQMFRHISTWFLTHLREKAFSVSG